MDIIHHFQQMTVQYLIHLQEEVKVVHVMVEELIIPHKVDAEEEEVDYPHLMVSLKQVFKVLLMGMVQD